MTIAYIKIEWVILCLTEAFALHAVPLIVNLHALTLNVLFRKLFPVSMHARLSLLHFLFYQSCSVYLLVCWDLWFTWIWLLFMLIIMNTFGFFYMLTSDLTSNINWNVFPSSVYFRFLKKKKESGVHRWVVLCLGLQFYSFDQYVCYMSYHVVNTTQKYNLKSWMVISLEVIL